MEQSISQNLERALADTEADAAAALKASEAVVTSVRKFRAAAKSGNLRELHASIEAAEKAIAGLRQQFANAKDGWRFDGEQYIASGDYTKEVVAVAERAGVRIFERDERLYCYPSLIRVSSNEKAVFIDKKRESRIRPSVLVDILKDRQRKPPRFRPENFLAALFAAYSRAVAIRGKGLSLEIAPVIPLVDIYELLTLLPGQSREYTKQEFARDIYLLHRSGVGATNTGARVTFPISRPVRGKILTVIDEAGEEKRYYGICFTSGSREP